MKHRYTAKIFFEDGETLINTGDNLEELTSWINSQAEAYFDEINAEIIDNSTQKTVKHFQYIPPE